MLLPVRCYQRRLGYWLKQLNAYDREYVQQRVNYYNKLSGAPVPLTDAHPVHDLKWPRKLKPYHFDTLEVARYFPSTVQLRFCFGDVTHVPEEPSLVKSRPIHGDNTNSVVLKLNKPRHYIFVNDRRSY